MSGTIDLTAFQNLDADKFIEMMLAQSERMGRHLNREVLGVCWTMGMKSAESAGDDWRSILAMWYAAGMAQGFLSSIEAMQVALMEAHELQTVEQVVAAVMAPFRLS